MKWFLIGLGVALVLSLGWHLRDRAAADAKIAELQAQRAARDSVIASLVRQSHRIDTVKVDRAVAHWDTVYAGIDLTDTAKTRKDLAEADKTIKTCHREFHDCAAQVANRDAQIGLLVQDTLDLAKELKAERAKAKGFRFLGLPLGCAAGVVVSNKGMQPGAGCGIRF